METLTAFVRERSRRNDAERKPLDYHERVSRHAYFAWLDAGKPDGEAERFWHVGVMREFFSEHPAVDIAACLVVINRRSKQSRKREQANHWRLRLSSASLEGAWEFRGAHLERSSFSDANLQRVSFISAHLQEANFFGADKVPTP